MDISEETKITELISQASVDTLESASISTLGLQTKTRKRKVTSPRKKYYGLYHTIDFYRKKGVPLNKSYGLFKSIMYYKNNGIYIPMEHPALLKQKR